MKRYYAQFFQKDLLGTVVEGLGDRAVLFLDGRVNTNLHHVWAAEHARKYKYVAYQLRKGSFTNYVDNSQRVVVHYES